MKLLVLSSIAPDFRHFRAGATVLANLLTEFARARVQVSVAVASVDERIHESQVKRLHSDGVAILEGPEFALESLADVPILKRKYSQLRSLFPLEAESDFPRFISSEAAVAKIVDHRPDAVLLFWDTHFEYILPDISKQNIPIYGYLAKPPQDSGIVRTKQLPNSIRKILMIRQLLSAQQRHIQRLKLLKSSKNICALDAAWYSRQGVKTQYLANTWPDSFGEPWCEIRQAAESKRKGTHILANIGGLNATGNSFGMRYLAESVIPMMGAKLEPSWRINICGRFVLPDRLKLLLTHQNIDLRGFVEDIDDEVAGNKLFLLLNNAGPYTGGYTRVMYAFSSGACLIAHSRLAESTPELRNGENCLLADTPIAIAEAICSAANSPDLRLRLGRAARETYQKSFSPAQVAKSLLEMIINESTKVSG